ncbi:TetR/AcrR family transcriptional regulator [Actinomadura mexicana]|uniref:Transcriptional regulator, TetR family n=1 Tax=Actinomadura mexicana TaxID=134959 RepID=A0A239H9E8_9ACTN|nr:TetR/AcrR family transcriptional regulator [Actinomadura mexicana]SNS77678.1 transcriptional regulator, TetR family [Actinomadura mexicana]
MSSDANREVKRRSRISPDRAAGLFALVLDRLREVGYEALSVESVAAQARMSKATIYRQWGGKPELVIAAVRSLGPLDVDGIDAGNLRDDLKAYIAQYHLMTAMDREMNRAVAHAIHRDARLMEAVRQALVEPGLAALDAILARAVGRGEVAADCPALPYVKYMLIGTLASEVHLGDTIDLDFLRGYVDHVVAPALGLPPAR